MSSALVETIPDAPADGQTYGRKDLGWSIAAGSGDMVKSVYDTGDNGVVDNSEALEGQNSAFHLARANHSGSQLAATISDFDTEVDNNPAVVLNTAKNSYPSGDSTKLSGIEALAEVNQTDGEIKTQYETNANTNAFTDAEKTKVAGLESSKFLGEFVSLGALQTAHPSPIAGSYANVDTGIGQDVVRYVWDSDDSIYVLQLGVSTSLTDAQIKTQYENNADTNAFTDAEQSKLSGVESGATADQSNAEIKTAYELNANTNEFSDAEQTKLSGIATGAIANIVEDTTPQLGGDLDLNAKGFKLVGLTVGGSDGNLVYLSSADTFSNANASAEATCASMLGIRISATEILTKGVFVTTGLTVGIYYASTSAGGITTTAPSTTGQIVRIIGYAISTTKFFFDPSKTYIEV